MPQLSWPEVRDRALRFSREWAGTSSESAEKQTFWNEFFEVFGLRRRNVATFEEPVARLRGSYGRIDLFWPGTMLVEHKSLGEDLGAASSQAFAYIRDLTREGRADEVPRYVIVSDFARFVLYDLEPDEQRDLPLFDQFRYATSDFPLSEFHLNVRKFAFVRGEKTVRLDPEDPANTKAYDLMCKLHDELEAGGFTGSDLERLLVRVLFCLFADDNGIFPAGTFQSFVREQTRDDGSDLGARLNELFAWLDSARADAPLDDTDPFAGFCYVNGRLFEDRLDFARFNREQRQTLLDCCAFQWARISPAVFGSLFQGIMGDRERRQQGAHYTTERDILKVVRSLFLDDLRAELDAALADRSSRRNQRLEDYHRRLRSLRFFDPACGCGNFLVVAYRELRRLELEVLRALHPGDVQQMLDVRQLLRVDVDQFHGLEYAEWPARIAEVAMWLMDHQMNQEASAAFGQYFQRLPLRSSPHIQVGNALRTDWRAFLPPGDEVFVLGNPPFVGHQWRTPEQQGDMAIIWGTEGRFGRLDYVTCWYRKAAEYIQGTRIRCAFVSTNSISQGEQVGILWGDLFQRGIKILFAHRTFSWKSEARGRAQVDVVIIGFAAFDVPIKRLYDYEADPTETEATVADVANIGPYLMSGGDVILPSRTDPRPGMPQMIKGSQPTDGGHLILTANAYDDLRREEPMTAQWLRRYMGGDELINGGERWCLWLKDADPSQLAACPRVIARIAAVRDARLQSPTPSVRAAAATPSLFTQDRQPTDSYLAVPEVSSENRRYIPIGFLRPDIVASNKLQIIVGATIFHFGVLSSIIHMAWVRVVAGRLESRLSYAPSVYNNYPWPAEVTDAQRTAVETAAQAVLDARAAFPTSTLADLYDPLLMPAPLVAAHAALDRAVDRCYRREAFPSDRARVEHLFALYERLTAPLLPQAPRSRRRGGRQAV